MVDSLCMLLPTSKPSHCYGCGVLYSNRIFKIYKKTYHPPGWLWTFSNHFYLSLLPGLSKKSAYRLNVTLMTSATGTVIIKKIFRSHKPYILSQKAYKVAPFSGATLNYLLTCSYTFTYKRKVAFAWNVFELERCGVANFFTTKFFKWLRL